MSESPIGYPEMLFAVTNTLWDSMYRELRYRPLRQHPQWVEKIQFVSYLPIPVDTSDVAEVEEWSERNKCVVADLKYLLQLPHDKFWCQVVFDETLHLLIDSYLRYAPRSAADLQDLPSDARSKHEKVHRLIFMTCLRMSTHKESKEAFITPKVYGEILYENFLFDIPKILDLCALYGDGNAALLEKMISNIFTQQPKYNDDLRMTIPTLFEVFDNVKIRCGLQKGQSPKKLVKMVVADSKPMDTMTVMELEDIILYVHDIGTTLAKFLEIYPQACQLFLQASYITELVIFYDLVIPELQNALKKKQPEITSLKKFKLKLLQTKNALLKHFNIIVSHCFLQPILERSLPVEELTEEYVQLITSILEERRFVADYEGKFSFHDDFDIILQTAKHEMRLQYIQGAINNAFATYGKRKSPKGAKNSGGRLSPEGATGPDDATRSQSVGQACAAVESSSHETTQSVTSIDGAKLENPYRGGKKVEEFEMTSMISCVKDLLPDLGDGFIELCLKEYDYNIERVIHSIMENELRPSLIEVDRHLARVVKRTEKEDGQILSHRQNIYDNDEFDVFSRDDVNTEKIHKGKQSKTDTICLDDKDEKRELKSRVQTYDLVSGLEDSEVCVGIYDDEYDDTYDVNDVGAADNDSADEFSNRRPFVTPRIFNKKPEGVEREESNSTDSETEEPVRRRDQFVQDPAEIRRRHAERMQAQRGGRKPFGASRSVHDVTGDKSKTGAVSDNVLKNRKWKESHKSSSGNHNRKVMASRKQNKGMF